MAVATKAAEGDRPSRGQAGTPLEGAVELPELLREVHGVAAQSPDAPVVRPAVAQEHEMREPFGVGVVRQKERYRFIEHEKHADYAAA